MDLNGSMDGPQWTSMDLICQKYPNVGANNHPEDLLHQKYPNVGANNHPEDLIHQKYPNVGANNHPEDLTCQKYPNVGANNHPEDLLRQKYPIVGRDTAFCRHGLGSPPTVEVGQPQWDDRPLPREEAKGDASRNPKAGGKPT